MIANKEYLLNGLIGTDRRQFVIPIYQRKYKWTNEQCTRLIDDIIKSGKKDIEHFTGTVVYESKGGSFRTAYLVDGQQRITTVMLMIKALSLITKSKPEDKDYDYVYRNTLRYLFADQNDHERGFKIVPSKNDQTTFNLIMACESLEELEKNPLVSKEKEDLLYNNFRTSYFRFIKEINDGNSVRDVIFEGLLDLTIVEMSLEHGDDPQEIFESINSLGVRLSNADLIRNYLLMSNVNQATLYKECWEPIQDSYIGEANMENFINNYLLMKKCYAINYSNIYKEYVDFASKIGDGENNKDELLKDLLEVAKIYQPFIKTSNSYSATTNMLMQELRDMAQTTAYPFLMRVFLDKQDGIISEETLNKVINLIIVYLVRRTICKVPTNSLRGFMLNLYNRIFGRVVANKQEERYYQAIYAFLKTLSSRDALPSEEDVSKKLKDYPLYKNVKFATYILYKIENGRYPKPYSEFVTAKSVTVEHIMPQNLTEEWIEDLGEDAEAIHELYVNTLGNLSLSSRDKNSSMSDDSFADKKEILMTDGSKFEVLNRSIKVLNKFTKKDIDNRELELEVILLEKFKLPEVDIQGFRFDDVVEVVCEEEVNPIFKGATPVAFRLYGQEVAVDGYANLLIKLCKSLLRRFPEKIRELASQNYSPWEGDKKYLYYSEEKENEIGEGIQLHLGLSAMSIVEFAIKLLKECGVEPDELTIVLKADTINKAYTLKKKDKVRLIRQALQELNDEGLLVYDYEKMPRSDAYIKYQLQEINDIFNTQELRTSWDGETFQCACYAEWFVGGNQVYVTLKVVKATKELVDMVNRNIETAGFNPNENNTNWWHIISLPVDFERILDAEDRVAEIKSQLASINNSIRETLGKIDK